ncbi:MAG: glycosyltransferase family 4 protein [Blastomonas sp.]|uniref:glycosyltransferase family 4 protein n=1 Tax=Blastomonas sp. TaxID=1909299 RepID=UPI00406A88C9|nr:glycosyltransferase family 4 protein [Blastomonas sp.]
MKVLIDARLGWGSGIGRYVANTVPHVARLRYDDSFDIAVMPDDVGRASEAMGGLENVGIRPVSITPFSIKEQIDFPVVAAGYDVTWFTNYWVPLAFNGRYIATVHDILHVRPDLFPTGLVKRQLAKRVFNKLARTASGVIFVSRFTCREFFAEFGAPKNWVVAHNGIDHSGWQAFNPLDIPVKSKRLLTVGASKAHKNFDMLVDAWQSAAVGSDWRLTIISPDDKLRSSIDLRAIGDRAKQTEILHGVSNARLREIYGEAQIMLTPSLYEGFGLPFMEAMQAGAFCISSTADAMVEIGAGAFAWYVNPRDQQGWTAAIEQACYLFDSGDFDFAPMQRHNMAHAAQFSWRSVGQATADMLDRI